MLYNYLQLPCVVAAGDHVRSQILRTDKAVELIAALLPTLIPFAVHDMDAYHLLGRSQNRGTNRLAHTTFFARASCVRLRES